MIIKHHPADFVVKENMHLPLGLGDYSYFLLHKEQWNTFDALSALSAHTHISLDRFGYAGNKDKHAITEQYFSVFRITDTAFDSLALPGITVRYIGKGNHRITLGNHTSNSFHIVVRDLHHKTSLFTSPVLNLFDTQRFSTHNAVIGKALVTQDFHTACQLLELPVEGNNFINTLRSIPRKLLRFYIHSYQAYLWNTIVQTLHPLPSHVPLIGYLTSFSPTAVKKAYTRLLAKENITSLHFLIKPFPELSSEGSDRKTFMTITDLTSTWDPDDLYPGSFKCTLSFTLDKGSYATTLIKTLFG